MSIAIGDKMPAGELGVMGADGPDKVSTDALFGGKKVVLFSVPERVHAYVSCEAPARLCRAG